MDEIQRLINDLREIPAMPNVVMQAINLIKDPNASVKDLANIISYDQSLSAKVLTLVNSAYYGFSQQITSINRALALIGMVKAKNLIITIAMRPMFTKQSDKELWKHSIRVAVGCEYFAKHKKLLNSDEAFVLGFMHDVGKMIFNMKDPLFYETIKERVEAGERPIDLENEYFGCNHTQTGIILAKKWQLPVLISNVMKYHHEPNESSMVVACSLVNAVDLLVQDNYKLEDIDLEISNTLGIDFSTSRAEVFRDEILEEADSLFSKLST
ncbi:HDOD domain-containing protein [bacterium]|nr:HDOD domain-containing protein [bacterium]